MYDTIQKLFEKDFPDAYPEWVQVKINELENALIERLNLGEQDQLTIQLGDLTETVELYGFMRGFVAGWQMMIDIDEGLNNE